jgi:aspartyl-tRNA(Asn)/glutamyl-tRNA(Gln) amidotransferase subunit A
VVEDRPLAGLRLCQPGTLLFDTLDTTVARAVERALSALSAAGARIVTRPLPELGEVAALNRPGGLSPIEAYAIHREAMATQRERFDPRVAARVALGEPVSAADYLALLEGRRAWSARTAAALDGFDALIGPTVPMVAPPVAPLLTDDDAFFRVNGLLLRNTFPINFLDGCAFSLPCQAPDDLPVGLMLAAPNGHDARLAAVARAVEHALQAAGLGG